jgi:Zn-dependent M32 family carboxypeptidase
MGFIRGVIAGVGLAVGAAAWYMSRAGAAFRDRTRVDQRLGQLGDEVELRTRDVRAQMGEQMAGMRSQMQDQMSEMRGRMGDDRQLGRTLDEAQAAAAEEAASMAADVEAKAAKMKKAAKSAEADAEG